MKRWNYQDPKENHTHSNEYERMKVGVTVAKDTYYEEVFSIPRSNECNDDNNDNNDNNNNRIRNRNRPDLHEYRIAIKNGTVFSKTIWHTLWESMKVEKAGIVK